MTIPDHFTTQFGANFMAAAQQESSRLKKYAIIETGCTGEAKTHNLYDAIDDEETTGERYKKVTLRDLETQKRWVRPRSFQTPTGESKWDEQLLAPTILPGGKHNQAHAAAYARRCDKVFVTGLLGTNYVGKDGVTTANIPASNIIAVDYVTSGSPAESSLTVDKIIRAKRILTGNESFGDDARARGIRLVGVMTAEMEENLLILANASNGTAANRLFSRDFMPPTLDENGNISFFMGIHWIRSEVLPRAEEDSTIQSASIFTSDALHFDVWSDITTTVAVRPDLSNAVQFLSQYMLGSVRSEDKKVVEILAKVDAA